MKTLGFLSLALAANLALAQSSFIDGLKTTPASKYDIAKLELRITLNRLGQELGGQAVGNTGFRVQSFRLEEQGEQLTIIGRLVGPGDRVEQARCQEITTAVREREGLRQVARNTWPGLSEAQYQEINQAVQVAAELVAEDNPNHGLRCE